MGKYVVHVLIISYKEDNIFTWLYMQRDPYMESTWLLHLGMIKEESAIRANGDFKEGGMLGCATSSICNQNGYRVRIR